MGSNSTLLSVSGGWKDVNSVTEVGQPAIIAASIHKHDSVLNSTMHCLCIVDAEKTIAMKLVLKHIKRDGVKRLKPL